jgi:hypothetical protein
MKQYRTTPPLEFLSVATVLGLGGGVSFKGETMKPLDRSTRSPIAERFTCADCTLNGHSARIKGRLLNYAVVTPDDQSIATAEFSWHTVERIMTEGNRAFRS